jgi:hypothetical protein
MILINMMIPVIILMMIIISYYSYNILLLNNNNNNMSNLEWINNFKNELLKFDFLHYDKIHNINFITIYCVNNNIDLIKKHTIDICNNILKSDKLIHFIINNNKQNNIIFSLKYLYMYSFDITYNDILNNNISNNYFSKIDIFKDITFNDTIKYFNSLNSIIIIYNYNNLKSKSKSKSSINTKKLKSYFNKTKKI